MKHGALMCYYSDFCQEYDKIDCSDISQNCHIIQGLNMSGR
jgi:hypothetical protein